jgi:hypothetical protein
LTFWAAKGRNAIVIETQFFMAVQKLSITGRACVVCLLLAVPARLLAAPLPPGGTLYPVPAEPDPVGGVLLGSVTAPVSSGLFTGTLVSKVYNGDTSNPFGASALTFTYQLSNNTSSTDPMERLTIASFAGFLIDASYQPASAGSFLTPTLVNLTPSGDTVGFSFLGSPVGPGTLLQGMTSALLVVQTDAQAFNGTIASVIDGTTAGVASLAPRMVPEPTSLALLGLGLVAFTQYRRLSRPRR